MESTVLSFRVDEQTLVKTGGVDKLASDTVDYVYAHFSLGTNWQGFDSVRAIWTAKGITLPAVLDSNGDCEVPHSIVAERAEVRVNLVGSIAEGGVLVDRLTSFPILATIVTKDANVDGDEDPITPSQFEQFVSYVKSDADRAESARDDAESAESNASQSAEDADIARINAESAQNSAEIAQGKAEDAQEEAERLVAQIQDLSAQGVQLLPSETAYASYNAQTGILTIGIPQGVQGVQGEQGEKGDKGDTGATGATGATGNGIASVTKTSTSGLVDTYTITFTNGQTTTFNVTNGEPSVDELARKSFGERYDITPVYDIYTGKIIAPSGEIQTAQTSFAVTDYIDLQDASAVLITTQIGFGNLLYAFYTEERTFISGAASASGGYTSITNERVSVPSNAKYIVVAKSVAITLKIVLCDALQPKNYDATSDITDFVISDNRFNKNGNIAEGYYLGTNGELIANAQWNTSDYCYVGDLSSVNASCKSSSSPVASRSIVSLYFLCTYDKDKHFIEQVASMPPNTVTLNEGVEYIRFCGSPTNFAAQFSVSQTNGRTNYCGYYKYEDLKKEARKAFKDCYDFEAVDFTVTRGKLLVGINGNILDFPNDTNYMVTSQIPVTPLEKVFVETQTDYSQGLCVFYDDNDEPIFIRKASGNALEHIAEILDVPPNASYMIVGDKDPSREPVIYRLIPQDAYRSGVWKNKKWACIGDSLTEYNLRTNVHYFDYIKAVKGIQIYNLGVSGTGYAKGDSNNFMTRISNVPTDSDVITIFGSGNDGSSGLQLGTASDTGTTTLGGCINTTLDNLFTIMPCANVGIITPSPWVNNMPFDSSQWMENYSNLLVAICKRRSIPCLDLYHCSGLNPDNSEVRTLAYSKDEGNGVHPNELGHKMLATKINAFLETLLIC